MANDEDYVNNYSLPAKVYKKCLSLAITHNDSNHIAKNKIGQVMSKNFWKRLFI